MKRYTEDAMDGLIQAIDGEWIRYADHVEAMKRIAGDGVAPSFDCSLASVDAHDPQSFIDGAKWAQQRLAAPSASAQQAEPVAWFAFANQNGPVPLEIYGWDEKACRNAVLEVARAEGWKGTVEGYLLHHEWTIRPLYAAPAPKSHLQQWSEVINQLPVSREEQPTPSAPPAALTDPKKSALAAMVDAMRWWGAQEDGIPAECHKAFDAAMLALGWSYSQPQDLKVLAASPAKENDNG